MKTYKRQLQAFCGLRLLLPQRFVRLSAAEEEARCHITWQEYDYQMWLAFCAPKEALEGVVLEPENFILARESLVLGYSDQVPVWVKLGPGKQLFLAQERSKKGQKNFTENFAGSYSKHS